jgi:hypothetical protein
MKVGDGGRRGPGLDTLGGEDWEGSGQPYKLIYIYILMNSALHYCMSEHAVLVISL